MIRRTAAVLVCLCACAIDGPADDESVQLEMISELQAQTPGLEFPFPPLSTDGEPLRGLQGRWTYTSFLDTACRDGSPSGVAINLGTTDKVMIYLEGGSACFNEQSCTYSAAQVPDTSVLGSSVAVHGIFDRAHPDNPVRDWNFVYVPYCSGDLQVGDNASAYVPGVGAQTFVGRANMEKFLRRIVPTFRDASDVLLTGASAGGWSALLNSVLYQRAFPNVRVKLLDDSGPPLSSAVLTECMQNSLRTLWRLDRTILGECGDRCPDPSDYMQDYAIFAALMLRDRPSGLVTSSRDQAMRTFFAVGQDDCTGSIPLASLAVALGLPGGVSAETWQTELLDFRKRLAPLPNFGTFYLDSDAHTWITGLEMVGLGADLYGAATGGVRLVDWIGRIIDGKLPAPGHAGL